MNIGKKFALANILAALLIFITNIIILTAMSAGAIPLGIIVIFFIVWVISLVIGISQLAIVTKEKTKHRGLHIANGILCILGIWIAVFIIALIINSREGKEYVPTNETEENYEEY